MIIFVDPKSGRGGGQVVLEQLLRLAQEIDQVGLAMPGPGRRSIQIPDSVKAFDHLGDLARALDPGEPLVIVANANASFPSVALWTRRLRRRGHRVVSVGIVHNYPSDRVRGAATVQSLRRLVHAIVVEPGLTTLRADAAIPSWLSVPSDFVLEVQEHINRTGRVKCFARPDSSKGLHLLPAIFEQLDVAGVSCHVALGSALDGEDRYAANLRADLAQWLEDGPRSSDWIEPGDVFLVPSVSGEAACLAAQEAMAKGAWVVASRLGLMPYLAPAGEGVTTFDVGSTSGAAQAVLDVLALPDESFSAGAVLSQRSISARQGLWYAEVGARIAALRDSVTTS